MEKSSATPCLCTLLRRASRAVTRAYDADFRETGLRITQYALLSLLHKSGEVRQGDLSALTCLEETSLTRALRVLQDNNWIAIRPGEDRREKFVAITKTGKIKLEAARPVWVKAQERVKQSLPKGAWEALFSLLPGVTSAASGL
ncbi:MAG TPA: MarR family transcriptional regulator [Schlesneria sp.]